jgi:hypothetical protein
MCIAEPGHPPGDEAPGAIVFDRIDDTLLALTRKASRTGHRRRVLVIATAVEPLNGGDAWRLLREA